VKDYAVKAEILIFCLPSSGIYGERLYFIILQVSFIPLRYGNIGFPMFIAALNSKFIYIIFKKSVPILKEKHTEFSLQISTA